MPGSAPALTRRDCLLGSGLLLSSDMATARGTPAPALSGALEKAIEDPRFNTRLLGRLQGDLSGRQRWIYNPGFVFATVPGRGLAPADFGRLLCRVEGFTSRISRALADGSIEELSHSWMFYRHPEQEAWLDNFDNPWTGERIEVPPYRGGPSHSWLRPTSGTELEAGGAAVESTAIGSPAKLSWRVINGQAWVSRFAASRIRTPTGAVRNEFSTDAWVCPLAELLDERRSHLPSIYSWTSQAEWPAWLRMEGRPGGVLWRIDSVVLEDPSQLPAAFAARMHELLPGKLEERLEW